MAAAAYRSGEKLVNEWDGMTHDYTRKGGVVHTEIMLPSHAPPEFQDRSTLWNSVEEIEKSATAQLAREIEVALPVELSRAEQLALVRAFVKDTASCSCGGRCAPACLWPPKPGLHSWPTPPSISRRYPAGSSRWCPPDDFSSRLCRQRYADPGCPDRTPCDTSRPMSHLLSADGW